MKTLVLALVLASATCAYAQHPQQTFITVGTPDLCEKQVQVLKDKLAEIGYPDRPWHWVVVCTEQTWASVVRKAQQDDKTWCAFSILDNGYTYLNGVRLSNPLPEVTPGYLIAHELGHLATRSTKEGDADRWAKDRGYRWGHKDEPKSSLAMN